MEEQIPFNFELKSREKLLEKCQDSMQLFREEKKKQEEKRRKEDKTRKGKISRGEPEAFVAWWSSREGRVINPANNAIDSGRY